MGLSDLPASELEDEEIKWGLGLREVPQDLSVTCMQALGILGKGGTSTRMARPTTSMATDTTNLESRQLIWKLSVYSKFISGNLRQLIWKLVQPIWQLEITNLETRCT